MDLLFNMFVFVEHTFPGKMGNHKKSSMYPYIGGGGEGGAGWQYYSR